MIMRRLRFIFGLAVHLYVTYMNSVTTTHNKTQFSTYNVKILYIIVLQLQGIWLLLSLHSSHHDRKTVRPPLNQQNERRLNDIRSIQQNCTVNFIWVHSGPA
jgi:L-asparagine transporter-like permease